MRKITLGTLSISDQGKRYVNDCLDSNRLSYGKYTREFEEKFATMHGCKHGIFMNSGTSALQVALAALKEAHGYKDGDEVLVPATTFIATSNIVLQNNMVPVFVDVNPRTYNMEYRKIEDKITPKTRAILPVHLFGLGANMIEVMDIAEERCLQVIEDSCEAVGSTVDGKPVGSFGDMGCFSTYVNHLVVGGVGGLVTTNDDRLAELCRSLMAHGRDSVYSSIDAANGLTGSGLQNVVERRFKFDRVGYSYRATELEAALALAELERFDGNVQKRRRNAQQLTESLKSLTGYLQLPYTPEDFTHSYMMFPIICLEGVDREKLTMFLEERGVETRFMFPLLDSPVYSKLFPRLLEQYPVSQNLARNGIMVGIHQGLGIEDMWYLADTILAYFQANQ
jgi:dTDP-4-amino-4,6-dideoxygalactose transaminase